MFLKSFITLSIFFVGQAIAQQLPSSIPPESGFANSLTQKNIGLRIQKFEQVFAPILKRFGRKLHVDFNWENPYWGSGTSQLNPKSYSIHLWGGLARHPFITIDAIDAFLCHELGHVLGFNLQANVLTRGTLVEGEADRFASSYCLPKLWASNQHVIPPSTPNSVLKRCMEAYPQLNNEQILCTRIAMAGHALFKAASVQGLPPHDKLDFDQPDSLIVEKTNLKGYPSLQCRLDIFFNSALSLYQSNTRLPCWYKEDVPRTKLDNEEFRSLSNRK